VTKDINMRLKAKGSGLEHVEDYRNDQVLDDVNLLTKGYECFPGSFWNHIERVNTTTLGTNTVHCMTPRLAPIYL